MDSLRRNGKLTRSGLVMLRTALINRWDLPDEIFSALPREVREIASDPESPPTLRLRAIETLMRMAEYNADQAREPSPEQHLHLHGDGPTLADQIKAIRNDRDATDWLEHNADAIRRAISDADTMGGACEPGDVRAPTTSNDDQPCGDGHDNRPEA